MAQTGFNQAPADAVVALAGYLEEPDLSAFRLACTQADTDTPTFEVMAQRFFSTLSTRLTGTDLRKLEAIAEHEQLRNYVKTIRIEEDPSRGHAVLPTATSLVWPRDELGMIYTTELEVQRFKALLVARTLCPETITIRDHDLDKAPAGVDAAYALARRITEGADLAIHSIGIQREHATTIQIILNLSAEHQGQGVGFSMLRSADLCVKSSTTTSYWVEQAFYYAPALEELRLSIAYSSGVQPNHHTLPMTGNPRFHLKQLVITSARLLATSILAILANSRYSLLGISFNGMTLPQGSTWRELLGSIAETFTELTYINLRFLSEGPMASSKVNFQGLTKDSVPEQYREGLQLFERGPPDKRRLSAVRYEGSGASEVLRVVAAHVVTQ